jgi:hypothetical protein
MLAATADETRSTGTGGETVLRAVGQAMRDAAATASVHAAKVRQSAGEAGYDSLETLSRVVYTGSYVLAYSVYVLAYSVVYAAVFAAKSQPQENPVMRGFGDGGEAALDRRASQANADQAAPAK